MLAYLHLGLIVTDNYSSIITDQTPIPNRQFTNKALIANDPNAFKCYERRKFK